MVIKRKGTPIPKTTTKPFSTKQRQLDALKIETSKSNGWNGVGWNGYGQTERNIQKPEEKQLLENELLTVLQNFDDLSDEEKRQVKKLLFQNSNMKMLDIEINNKFHISKQSNPVRLEALKLLLDKKIDNLSLIEVIGYYEGCDFPVYANKKLPAEYDQKFADYIEPYALWQGEIYYIIGIGRQPVLDICSKKLIDIASSDDCLLREARDIIDDLIQMKMLDIGKAVSIFVSKTKDNSQYKAFMKQYPESDRYFQLL
jgi:hypothetical protein